MKVRSTKQGARRGETGTDGLGVRARRRARPRAFGLRYAMTVGVLVALSGTTSLSRSAQAQATTTTGKEASEAAVLTREGAQRFDRKDFLGAREAFQRAYQLDPRPELLTDIALAELNAGMHEAAIEHLRAFLQTPGVSSSQSDAIRQQVLPKAYSHVGQLSIALPEGSTVRVDGRETVVTVGENKTIIVTPGTHEILTVDNRKATVTVDPGAHVEVTLPHAPPPPPPPKPAAAPPPPTPTKAKRSSWGTRSTVLTAGASVAILAAGGSAYFFARYVSEKNRAEDLLNSLRSSAGPSACSATPLSMPSDCGELVDAYDARGANYRLAGISLVVAGVAAAGTIAGLLFWKGPDETTSVGLTPVVTRDGGGITVLGTY